MIRPMMSRRRLAALLALSMPAFPALAQVLPDTSAPTRPLDGTRRLTVETLINGQGPYPFMIDTGASASVISRDLVARLDLPPGPRSRLHSVAGAEMVDTVRVRSLAVGRRERRDLTASVASSRFMQVAGILGQDWLGSQGLILDFARDQMRLGTRLPREDELAVSVPLRTQRNGLHLIEGVVRATSVLAFLDTGSTTTVGNLALMTEAMAKGAIGKDWADIELQSVTGQSMTGRLAALKSLRLGKMTLRNLPVVFGAVHTFDYWGLTDRPAILLGNDVLNTFDSVALDYNRGQVHFQLSAASAKRGAATT